MVILKPRVCTQNLTQILNQISVVPYKVCAFKLGIEVSKAQFSVCKKTAIVLLNCLDTVWELTDTEHLVNSKCAPGFTYPPHSQPGISSAITHFTDEETEFNGS